jgi:VIT1/CCC1 family predicted Fe2+/Mn2+ transporter
VKRSNRLSYSPVVAGSRLQPPRLYPKKAPFDESVQAAARGIPSFWFTGLMSATTHTEPHAANIGQRLNWLRAGVLGANDGIVSVAAVAVGVAGATSDLGPIVTATSAALVGGAISMALGEYVSVSSQRDTERALIEKEKRELAEMPAEELAELTQLYREKGLSDDTARRVAEELTAHDALGAHLDAELGIDPDELTSPWQAAISSAISFTLGALLPLLAILLPPADWRVPTTFVAVVIALALTGTLSAVLGGAGKRRAVLRLVGGGALALAVTWALGLLLGTSVL